MVLVSQGVGRAQSKPPEPYPFSAQGHAALARLRGLETLPANDWEYHVGNVVNGELANLDTHDWKTIRIPFLRRRARYGCAAGLRCRKRYMDTIWRAPAFGSN